MTAISPLTAPAKTAPTIAPGEPVNVPNPLNTRPPRNPNLPWDLPVPKAPAADAVAQLSTRVGNHFGMGEWADVFAVGPDISPQDNWNSIEDAMRGAEGLSKTSNQAIGVFQKFDHNMPTGWELRHLEVEDVRTNGARVPLNRKVWANEPNPGHGAVVWVVGAQAVNHTFRAIFDNGSLIPQVGPLG